MTINTHKGQSLFEVVFAIGIAAIIITGVVIVSTTSIRNSTYSKNNSQATKYAQDEMEWLRSQRDLSWTGFTTGAAGGTGCSGTYSWGGSCTIDSFYTRSATFACKDAAEAAATCNSAASIVDVTVNVSWTDAQGTHSVSSSTRFTNWNK